ncbi:ISL3 family transposase [Ochrobactrum soli]|uniref:ISL3 family transposase n=1 Tax=Ochrobactrum soli TaxID=2448455 RepID=A0A849KDT6_9HYPH|nr:ISL3 family transposase [[Ochrobactrum] soli]NNU59705.1 ISL3 family transposase [[Ochrobactrum] soli]
MADILGIEGLTVDIDKTVETDTNITIRVKRRPKGMTACPRCRNAFIRPNGSRLVTYRDLPVRGKTVTIEWERQRYMCLNTGSDTWQCGQSFSDEHEELHPSRLMTMRLFEYIGRRCLKHTFASVAADINVDEKTVRNVFEAWVERQVYEMGDPIAPRVLGIDEVHLLHQARGIMTNVVERTLYDLLPDRRRETIATRIQAMPDRDEVEVVTMDMWRPYRDVVHALMPQADIVIDKWHVVKMANEALEAARKSFRKELSAKRRRTLLNDRFLLLKRRHKLTPMQELLLQAWTKEFPILGHAYAAKEGFYAVYDELSAEEARDTYAIWLDSLTDEMKAFFQPLIRAVGNWDEEVFNYFRFPKLTNAYTEALNGLVKIANRNGRGYSFDVLRAKMMFQYSEAAKDEGVPPGAALSVLPGQQHPEFVGMDMATLAALLEEEFNHGHSTELSG